MRKIAKMSIICNILIILLSIYAVGNDYIMFDIHGPYYEKNVDYDDTYHAYGVIELNCSLDEGITDVVSDGLYSSYIVIWTNDTLTFDLLYCSNLVGWLSIVFIGTIDINGRIYNSTDLLVNYIYLRIGKSLNITSLVVSHIMELVLKVGFSDPRPKVTLVRIHHSYLVNWKKVEKFIASFVKIKVA